MAFFDGKGEAFEPSSRSAAVLTAAGLHATPLNTALRPGESYISYAVSEIPANSNGLRLLLTSADEETHLIWGHENSFFHKKAYFMLPVS